MSKRERCAQCQRPRSHCYCQRLVKVDNPWPVRILQHPQEAKHALGTARIAALCLKRCELEVAATPTDGSLTSPTPILVYPGPESLPLDALIGLPIRPLLFLDATWRKSRRMVLETPALAALPQYCLPAPPASRYRIRRAPSPHALSTLEAIVHSLTLLEGVREKYEPLLQILDSLIDEQIVQMGPEVYGHNYKQK